MNENALLIALRLVHILSGVFWVGTAVLIAWFLIPSQKSTGLAGMTFIYELMIRRKLRASLFIAMFLTILSGLTMYVYLVVGSDGRWAQTTTAKVLGFGALCAIVGGGWAGSVSAVTGGKLAALGKTIQDSGQPPNEAQMAQMNVFQDQIQRVTQIAAVLLIIAVAAMASARYL